MHILFDGKNCAYRAAYACKRSENSGYNRTYHPFVQFARQLSEIVEKFKPTAITCVWDAPRDTVWRKQIFPLYKDRKDNDYIEGLKEYLHKIEDASHQLLPYIGFRVLKKATQETDDLIYSLCRMLHPEEVLIVSSDKDFTQITYRMPNVQLYDPQEKEITPKPTLDPVVTKSLAGDTSDRIDGYYGIGKVKSADLAADVAKRYNFLEQSGIALYLRNVTLIDLAYNPNLSKNDYYVAKALAVPTAFNKKGLEKAALEHKIFGIMQDYDTAVMPIQLYLAKQ